MFRQFSSQQIGIFLCILAMAIFAIMDAVTKLAIQDYSAPQIIMVRYWLFAALVVYLAKRKLGLRATFRSARPGLQFLRSILIVLEAVVMAIAFRHLGLAETHALFAVSPLIVTVLAGLVLGEAVGWRRRIAVLIGFAGAVMIIQPGLGVLQIAALLPLAAAGLWALYSIVTRYTGQVDSFETSLAFMALVGALAVTPLAITSWQMPDAEGWMLILIIAVLGITSHLLLIKALALAEASVLQPFSYFLLGWATLIGVVIYGERPDALSIAGTVLIAASGLFTILRERKLNTGSDQSPPPV